MARSNNKTYGKWQGKDFNKEGKKSMKWKNNPMHAEQVRVKKLKTKASSGVMHVVSMDTLFLEAKLELALDAITLHTKLYVRDDDDDDEIVDAID
nr:hypothetical protein [Tanacetum cinerariifolium]